jgi:hypothetical protein
MSDSLQSGELGVDVRRNDDDGRNCDIKRIFNKLIIKLTIFLLPTGDFSQQDIAKNGTQFLHAICTNFCKSIASIADGTGR